MKFGKNIGLTKKVTSFAQKRSQDSRAKYKKALDERKRLIRAQYASEKPLDEMYKARGNMVDRRISRLRPTDSRKNY